MTRGDQTLDFPPRLSFVARPFLPPLLPFIPRAFPVSLPHQVTFLNITGFRDCPLSDMPMLEVLRQASERVFVPLTVGGGIKGMTVDGKSYSALEVRCVWWCCV